MQLLVRLRASSDKSSWDPVIPILLAIFIAMVSVMNQFQGVDWGDDFALYMRQAKAIAIGNVGEVLSDNRFSVDNSGWNSFSPYSYPWGWPLIVAPFYAFAGLNYELFKMIEVLALALFVATFYVLTRRRLGTDGALILSLLIGLAPGYIGWTNTVLSDLPYLCFVGISLWWMDVCRRRSLTTETKTGALIFLGLLIAFTFNIRREGIVLLFALTALNGFLVVQQVVRARTISAFRTVPWNRMLVPYATFFGSIITFHLILPTVLWPRPAEAGLQNIPARASYFFEVLAEQIGLKVPGAAMSLFGSESLARRVGLVVIAMAVVGLVLRLAAAGEKDVAMAGYLLGASLVMGMSPYQEGRYLLSITPFLLYFAYQAIPTLAGLITKSSLVQRIALTLPALLFIGLAFLSFDDLWNSIQYHRDYDYVVNGPETDNAQQMFATVKERTLPDDVVLFFRARAMTFYTDRRAIQGSNLEKLLPRVGWYVMEKGSSYSQRLLTDEEAAGFGLEKAWENDGWVMWRVTRMDGERWN